jgi:hypothetical protein
LQKWVFLDPTFIFSIVRDLKQAYKAKYISNGILGHKFLKLVWKDIPSSLYPTLIVLLEKLGISTQLKTYKDESSFERGFSLFPVFLQKSFDYSEKEVSSNAILSSSSVSNSRKGSFSLDGSNLNVSMFAAALQGQNADV